MFRPRSAEARRAVECALVAPGEVCVSLPLVGRGLCGGERGLLGRLCGELDYGRGDGALYGCDGGAYAAADKDEPRAIVGERSTRDAHWCSREICDFLALELKRLTRRLGLAWFKSSGWMRER